MEQTDEERLSMQDAEDRAREHPQDWSAALAKLDKVWGDKAPEETPSKETGDSHTFAEGLDLSDPNALQLHAPSGGALDVISGGSVDEPKPEGAPEAPKPLPAVPTEPWAKLQHELNQQQQPKADPLAAKMASVGWAPKMTSAPPNWEQLQKDLQDAQGRAGAMRTIQQSFHAVAPRFQADPNAGSEDIAAAKAPLEMEQAKQMFEAKQNADAAQQIAAHEKLLGEDKRRRLEDPNSTESQRAREALRPVFQMAGNVPDGFDKWTAADVEQHAKALVPIAKDVSDENRAKAKSAESEKAKAAALQDRQNVMYKQYVDDPSLNLPDDERERRRALIASLHDVGDAQSVQTALEGRLSRENTQQHQDTAAAKARSEREQEAAIAAARSLQNAKALKDYEAAHQNMSTEQKQAFEGFAALPGVINTLRDSLKETNTWQGKLGARFPEIAGAIGAPGATFESSTDAAASVLARIVDGGVARPGTIEIVKHYLPRANDTEGVKEKKLHDLEKYVESKQSGYLEALKKEGVRVPEQPGQPPKGDGPPPAGTVTLFNTKTRRSANVTPAKAKEVMSAEGGGDYQIVGEPHQ